MSTKRFLSLFLIGFLLQPLCDGFWLLPERPQGRGLATLLLMVLVGVPLGLGCWLARPWLGRLLPAHARAADALPLAAGLACALVPQWAPLLPGRELGGRLSYHPVWAPASTLLGIGLFIAVLGRLLPRMPLRSTPLTVFMLGAWCTVAAGFGWRDAVTQRALRAEQCGPLGAVAAPRTPDVTLIVLDTLRAGGILGSWMDQDLMPHTRALLADARCFTHAYAASNCTPPGHSALFTGGYPAETGTLARGHTRLPAAELTLAELLREHGYRTVGVVSNARLDALLGFAQGFEVWDESLVVDPSGRHHALQRVAKASIVRALGGKPMTLRLNALAARLAGHDQSRITAAETSSRVGAALDAAFAAGAHRAPVHLFVNYIDPHVPYVTRADLAQAFLPNLVDPVMEAARTNMPALQRQLAVLTGELERGAGREHDAVLDRQLAWIEEAYWEQSRQLDEGLRDLFGHLRRHGLLDAEDLVVLTSDHGEELGEHPVFGHGAALFQGSVRVPLVLLGGGFAPGVDARVVSGVDLFPTVLDLLGVASEARARNLQGYALQGVLPEPRVARFESGPLRGFVAGAHKLIAFDHGDRLVWTHAFDLAADPGERRNLLGLDVPPAWVREWIVAPPFGPARDAVRRVVAEAGPDLAALGYADEGGTPR